MFEVYSKNPESICDEMSSTRVKKTVYSVQYKNGYPFFTFYESGRWVTRSAKHYVPIKEEIK